MRHIAVLATVLSVAFAAFTQSGWIGGPGGNLFNDPLGTGVRITSVTFRQADGGLSFRVGNIQYTYSDGTSRNWGVCYGGTTATATLTFDADESVRSVELRADSSSFVGGSYITWIRLTTTKGRTITSGNAFGGGSATYTVPANAEFGGFYGRSGCWIDAWGIYYKTPDQICGDGTVQPGEDCDGGSCCTAACKFSASTTVCRAAAGNCDVAEKCTGNSATCPADALVPANTPCGEFFGACDVQLTKSCTGTSAQCFGPPAFPALSTVISWSDFNVISFDGYNCNGGDVEGRLASRNSFNVDGFALGKELRFATDSWRPYSLFVGGDASFANGKIYPDGTDLDNSGPQVFAYVGGVFTAPADLQAYYLNNISSADALNAFDGAKTYYTDIQSRLAALPKNAQASVQYTDGLLITCAETNDLYHVQVDGATLSTINWIQLQGCRFSARWIIDVTGTGNVVIKGQPFPGIVERVIYNILGSGRTITGQTGVAGHIIAPNNIYTQDNGVTYGLVIVGNVAQARQNNKPNCVTFRPVTLSTKIVKPVRIGDTTVFVADFGQFIAGDLICISGDCRKIVAGNIADVDGDGVVDHVITVDSAFGQDHSGNNLLGTTDVSNPTTANRDTTLYSSPAANTMASNPVSSGMQLVASVLGVAATALLF